MSLRHALEAEGWALVRGLLDDDALRARLALLDWLRERVPPSREVLYTHAPPAEPRPGMDRLMEQWLNAHRRSDAPGTRQGIKAARGLATEILGAGATLFQDVLMVKHPRHAPFPWHQDYAYWPVDRPEGVVIWVPLDPVGPENGGLAVAPGSHRDGPGPAVDLHTGAPQVGSVGGLPSELRAFIPEMDPGDAVVFHALTWHGSGPNRSPLPRRAWSSSWVSEACRWAPERTPRHPLADRVRSGAKIEEGV